LVICSTFILFFIQTFVVHLGHWKVKRKTLKILSTLKSLCSTYLHHFQQWPSFNQDNKLIPSMLSLINLLPISFFCEYLPFNLPSSIVSIHSKRMRLKVGGWSVGATWGSTHLQCILNFSTIKSNYGVCCVFIYFFSICT